MFNSTPGPWKYKTPLLIVSPDGTCVARTCATLGKYEAEEANARRIVACVNACQNFTTKDLEEVGENFSGVLADTRKRCAELVAQSDELLAALKNHQTQTRPIQETMDLIARLESK